MNAGSHIQDIQFQIFVYMDMAAGDFLTKESDASTLVPQKIQILKHSIT